MRLPVLPNVSTKDGTSNKNARLTNVLKVSGPKEIAEVRPALVESAHSSGAAGGIVSFNNELISVYGTTLGFGTSEAWIAATTTLTSAGYSACFSGTYFHVLGSGGEVYRSVDGDVWNQFTGSTAIETTGYLISASGQHVCFFPKADGSVYVSHDYGGTFTEFASPSWFSSGLDQASITHDGTYFIGCFVDGDTNVTMGRSADGETWTQTGDRPAWQTNLVTGFASNGSTIIACNGGNGAVYSTDHGLTWNDSELQPSEDPYCAAYGNDLFVVTAEYLGGSINVYASTDGIDFNSATSVSTIPAIASGGTLTFNGSVFVYTDYDSNFYTSADAITWNKHIDSGGITWITVASGNNYSVSSDQVTLSTARLTTGIAAAATIQQGKYDFAQSVT